MTATDHIPAAESAKVRQRKYGLEETAERGQAIYERDIRPLVEPEHNGKFLVLDIDTGDYEIDTKDITACLRLYARRPDAATWLVRVGRLTTRQWLHMTRPRP